MQLISNPVDEAIRKAFFAADKLVFMARPFNHIRWRTINFAGASPDGCPILVLELMPIIGVTPKMLAPVWNPGADVHTYEQLGHFPLDEERFVQLARILKKQIDVIREDGSTRGEHQFLFTISPSGQLSVPR